MACPCGSRDEGERRKKAPRFHFLRQSGFVSALFYFLVYNKNMSNKPLTKTNPYLKDPEKRKSMLYTTVSSSTAIEGVHAAVDKAIKAVKKSGDIVILSESVVSGKSRR